METGPVEDVTASISVPAAAASSAARAIVAVMAAVVLGLTTRMRMGKPHAGMAADWTAVASVRKQRAKCWDPRAIGSGTALMQPSLASVQRGWKAQPGGRFARSGGLPAIAGRRLPDRRPPCARVDRRPIV